MLHNSQHCLVCPKNFKFDSVYEDEAEEELSENEISNLKSKEANKLIPNQFINNIQDFRNEKENIYSSNKLDSKDCIRNEGLPLVFDYDEECSLSLDSNLYLNQELLI